MALHEQKSITQNSPSKSDGSYHSTFHLYEDATLQRLNKQDDVLEIHFIELNKFLAMWEKDELNAFDDILVRWLLLLSIVDARKHKVYDDIYKELEALAMKDEALALAFSAWEELSLSKKDVLAYQSRLKYILDEEGKLDDVRHKAQIERDIEIAKNLIKKNMDNSFIADVTKLSMKQIEELRLNK